MLISSPTASVPSAATAALDRAAPDAAAEASSSDASSTADASPDVVVTLGGNRPAVSTYDATGRMPGGASSLEYLGANGPRSLAHATEALSDGGGGDDDAAPASAPDDVAGG